MITNAVSDGNEPVWMTSEDIDDTRTQGSWADLSISYSRDHQDKINSPSLIKGIWTDQQLSKPWDWLKLNIEQISPFKENCICAAHKKKSFWKKHKKTIIIVVVVVVIVTTVVVVTIYTGGTGSATAGAIAGAGAELLEQMLDEPDEKTTHYIPYAQPSSPDIPRIVPPPMGADPQLEFSTPPSNDISIPPPSLPTFDISYSSLDSSIPPLPPASQPSPDTIYLDRGFIHNDQYTPYPVPPGIGLFSPPYSYAARPIDISASQTDETPDIDYHKYFGNMPWLSENAHPPIMGAPSPNDPIPQTVEKNSENCAPKEPFGSRLLNIEGHRNKKIGIGGINGINTSTDEAIAHGRYLQRDFNPYAIDWVYNQSYGAVLGTMEVGCLNYMGFSPNTADLLRMNWIQFYQDNIDNPNAKYLQFCHSQGAVHTKNALFGLPQEIKDRIIVVAIAPAEPVPKGMCYEVFNYASSSDIIPKLGQFVTFMKDFNTAEFMDIPFSEYCLNETPLIIIPAAEGTHWPDHDFQSPTFEEIIKNHIKDHLKREGENL